MVKELKLIYVCQRYHKNKSGAFYHGSQCICVTQISPFAPEQLVPRVLYFSYSVTVRAHYTMHCTHVVLYNSNCYYIRTT